MGLKFYLLSKQIHRLMVLVVSTLLLLMGFSGLVMYFSSFTQKYFLFIDLGMVRFVHNRLSLYFLIALAIMAITGLYMYFFPLIRKNSPRTPSNK